MFMYISIFWVKKWKSVNLTENDNFGNKLELCSFVPRRHTVQPLFQNSTSSAVAISQNLTHNAYFDVLCLHRSHNSCIILHILLIHSTHFFDNYSFTLLGYYSLTSAVFTVSLSHVTVLPSAVCSRRKPSPACLDCGFDSVTWFSIICGWSRKRLSGTDFAVNNQQRLVLLDFT